MTNFYTLYIHTLWISAYIYGVVKPPIVDFIGTLSRATRSTCYVIYNYFTTYSNHSIHDQKDESNISLFVSDGKIMIPFSFDINLLDKHHLLYYVVIKIDDNHNKVIVFNSLDKLIFLYKNLEEIATQRVSKFSKYLDVRNTNSNDIDYVDIFNQYVDKSGVLFSDITNYKLKARDIYDFDNNTFILSHGDKLHVTKMDLSSQQYHFEEHIIV
jgi:hypothetical protein